MMLQHFYKQQYLEAQANAQAQMLLNQNIQHQQNIYL